MSASPPDFGRRLGLKGVAAGAAAALPGLALGQSPAKKPDAGKLMTTGPVARLGPDARVFRYAFPVAETGFDSVRVNDLYSRIVTGNIFEAPYAYDHLARPARIVPLTAVALPETNEDFTRFVIRIRPGIFFADDPAFKGQRRELTAEDYVYTVKRYADPTTKSPNWSGIDELGLLGLAEQRDKVVKGGGRFDYDARVEGLRTLDRYTFELRTREPRPRLVEVFADSSHVGAVAREVVEAYGEQIPAHPVGTGPFRLVSWRRSSEIMLDRNPGYRERFYEDDAHPNADDAAGQALLAKFRGRRLPMVDRVIVSIIEEQQPRWLAFLNGQQDFIERVGAEFVPMGMPGGVVAPNLARKGIQGWRQVGAEGTMTCYNMEHPLVGGYEPHKVALRRAINLAVDVEREIRVVRRGQAIRAQSPVVPHTSGYDPAFRSEQGEYSVEKAKALLDTWGWVDKDGDGWRETPDGQPLKLVRNTQSDADSRGQDELWNRCMRDIGVRIEFKVAQWPENLRAARAGNYMIWGVGSSATQYDGQYSLQRLYGPGSGGQNLSRFRLAAFDRLYEKMSSVPDGPERERMFFEAKRMAAAWAPYKYHVHRIYTDMAQPWVEGWVRPAFWHRWWHLVDIDPAVKARAGG